MTSSPFASPPIASRRGAAVRRFMALTVFRYPKKM
jgi:hypothetical protein